MRVLITRPRKEATEFAQALGEIGAEAIFFPTITICPVKDTSVLDRAISHLREYDWLVLTSANPGCGHRFQNSRPASGGWCFTALHPRRIRRRSNLTRIRRFKRALGATPSG